MTSQPKDANLIWLVLHVFCLAALVGLTLLPTTTAAQSNPVVLENQQPGTTQWQIPWGSSATDSAGQIKGYASAVSVNKGQNITFYVSVNPAQTYTIDVYRMGWYQGLGGRLVQHIGPLNGTLQPACPTNATTGMIECQWASAYTLATQSSWTSGIYVALLTNAQKFQNYIVFAVRDDSRVAALLYQQPVTTYQAYNNYPDDNTTGKSLYAFNSNGATTISGGKNAVKVSFDRPYEGNGTGNIYSQSFFSWEYPFVRWMEKSGYDVTYATDVDTHTNGRMLLNYLASISPSGHDEYWTKPMYDAWIAALNAGVNLGFFGANAIYWQARLEFSTSGVPNRVLVCYRSASIDPTTDPTLVTVNWRDPLLNRPEQTLMGVQYTNQTQWTSQNNGYYPYVVRNSGSWVYAGTGFKDGDTVPGIVGYEADRQFGQYPLPNAVNGTYTLLSSSPFPSNASTSDFSNSSIYQAPSGAWVFASGTIGWSYGLDNYSSANAVDPRIQQTTANILNRFITPLSNFTLAASPLSQTVLPGGSTSYSVAISPTGGFTGQVNLSVGGLPSGASGSFAPNPATASSTLSVTTGTGTPVGTYTLTITGISGSLTHTTTVSLTVATEQTSVTFDNRVSSGFQFGVTTVSTPAFTIGSGTNRAAMIMVAMGGNNATSITASLGGVSGTVVAGSDSGATTAIRTLLFCVSNPPSGSQTATVSWTTSMNVDVGVITVSGANQTTPCTNGTFAATNSAPTATTSVTITSNPGDLTASMGATENTWVSPFTNQTLKWGVDASEVGGDIGPGTGTTTHTWTDQYAGQTHSVSGANFKAATNGPADFTLGASPSSQTVTPGGSTSYSVNISPMGGFSGQVNLSVSGLPSGASGSFAPNPATASSTLSVTTGTGTPVGTYTLTITGVSGSLTHTTTVSLTVAAAVNFTLGASPSSQTVTPGGPTSYSETISPTGGFNGQVNLSRGGLPRGASGSFAPNPATASSTLSVTTGTGTPVGTYTLTITGVSGSLTHTTTVSLVVSAA